MNHHAKLDIRTGVDLKYYTQVRMTSKYSANVSGLELLFVQGIIFNGFRGHYGHVSVSSVDIYQGYGNLTDTEYTNGFQLVIEMVSDISLRL